ncbi:PREDICTED: FIT family protein CG10671 [Ceratosolen solmsi marchali]|uniref:FIT family protein CG10671 n=1 Tax=Ceratosolen solmsi marchali TaxID=326594 RepID=A0AAJ7DUU5_9HYME|nr:PREDICTED: FIT family protein CG10671 [Ceratosolen solmsi marchali]
MSWINVFHYFETNYGRCFNTRDRSIQLKSKCMEAGNFWSSLDISGHAFIIIYSSLILSEEGYSLIGWEGIKDIIMNEEYNRRTSSENNKGYLQNLSDKDLNFLKKAHKALTPYLRGLFITMTIQQIIWDVMLIATILYYHTMIEKFIGGVAAILTWYVSYYWLFRLSQIGMVLPGDGIFKYNKLKEKQQDNIAKPKRYILKKERMFMGMPIRFRKEEIEKNDNNFKDIGSNLFYRKN